MSDECLTKLCSICNSRITGVSWYCPDCKVCICFIRGICKADLKCPQCGRNIIRAKIVNREERLTTVLRQDNYKHVIPSADSLEEAIQYIERLYKSTEGTFTTYYFAL